MVCVLQLADSDPEDEGGHVQLKEERWEDEDKLSESKHAHTHTLSSSSVEFLSTCSHTRRFIREERCITTAGLISDI